MPKSKLSEIISQQNDKDFVNNIRLNISYEMVICGMSIKDLALKSGISENTFRLRMNAPDTFRIDEIARICKALKVSPYKLAGQKLIYEKVKE